MSTSLPQRSFIKAFALGPWICTGQASISLIWTLNLSSAFTPCRYNPISLSDKLNQNSSLEILKRIGSFNTPPYELHKITYLPLIGEIFVASLVIT